MLNRLSVAAGLACIAMACHGQNASTFDAARAFGARPSASHLHISPDGNSVVYIAPSKGQGSTAYTLSLAPGSLAKPVLAADGKPSRLQDCRWVSNDRLACRIYATEKVDPMIGVTTLTRIMAVDADGKNLRMLSAQQSPYARGYAINGGGIIDWLPDENGAVLMRRQYLADDHIGSHIGRKTGGWGVDWINTRDLASKQIEPPDPEATGYVSDGRGTVRIMGTKQVEDGRDTGTLTFLYRLAGSRDWHTLSHFNEFDRSGFYPLAIDHDHNIAYGLKKKDGRMAAYSVTLDEALHEEVVSERPDVDVDGLIYIGRDNRVVGTHFNDTRTAYFTPEMRSLVGSLGKALPNHTIDVVDSSLDQNRLLVLSSSDEDPGAYYIFDRKTHQLQTFLAVRAELEGVRLGQMKAITYPASDGTPIAAHLTLPPGKEEAKSLPAIVLPHSDPSRGGWAFDWLAQYFAARGFAVLQPDFRGSGGNGESWFLQNGFKSWPTVIGDVSDGGRWLIQQGIADPARLAIVGWSYGGYAALQSAAVNPELFKAVVAIAPVSDLAEFKEESRYWSDFNVVSDFIGSGPHMHEGSPVEQAARIKAPVLLFHGALDASVGIIQSKNMAARLHSVGGTCELVTWDNLDHYLEDSDARAQMLRKSDEFLRQALGM